MGRIAGPQKDENKRIIEQVNKFRETGDEFAFQDITKSLHSYLMHLSSRKFYRIPGHGADDVYQEGLVALSTKAIPDYDEEKGTFLSFAKLCIRRHIITVLKSANNTKNKALNKSLSLEAPAKDDREDGQVPVSGIIPSDEEEAVVSLSRKEDHANSKQFLRERLTPLESKVFDCYLENMSYIDIVEKMNRRLRGKNRVNPKVIDNALCRVKKKAVELEQEMKRKSTLASTGLFPIIAQKRNGKGDSDGVLPGEQRLVLSSGKAGRRHLGPGKRTKRSVKVPERKGRRRKAVHLRR